MRNSWLIVVSLPAVGCAGPRQDPGGWTLVQGGGPEWWGAAVTTLTPILQ